VYTETNFNKYNETATKKFNAQRNAAVGSLRLKDASKKKNRTLTFLPFDDNSEEDMLIKLERFKTMGLPIEFKYLNSIDELKVPVEFSKEYPSDGKVFRTESYKDYIEAGFTEHHPRGAIALKFEELAGTTTLLDIEYTVGSTGKVTPVASLAPITLKGHTYAKASLHNLASIRKLDMHVGDKVIIIIAGEIIPQIKTVVGGGKGASLKVPEYCKCGTKFEHVDQLTYCRNYSCQEATIARIIRFCSKKGMNINIGEATISQLYNAKLILTASDLYKLRYADIVNLPNFGELSAKNLLQSIDESKFPKAHNFIYAVNIPSIAVATAKRLIKALGSVGALVSATFEELIEIDNIGEVTANSILEWSDQSVNIEELKALKSQGVTIEYLQEEDLLNGEIWVITGTFELEREKLKELLERYGAKVTSSISGKTTAVLAGKKPAASKIEKAQNNNIKIINYEYIKNILPILRETS